MKIFSWCIVNYWYASKFELWKFRIFSVSQLLIDLVILEFEMEVSNEEQKAFIKIQFLSGGQTAKDPCQPCWSLWRCCFRNEQKWCKRFEEGSSDTKDAARCGRLISATGLDQEILQEVEELLQDDRRWTCEELSEKLDISAVSVYRILTQDLVMRKVAARWIPHQLTTEQKEHLHTASVPIEEGDWISW